MRPRGGDASRGARRGDAFRPATRDKIREAFERAGGAGVPARLAHAVRTGAVVALTDPFDVPGGGVTFAAEAAKRQTTDAVDREGPRGDLERVDAVTRDGARGREAHAVVTWWDAELEPGAAPARFSASPFEDARPLGGAAEHHSARQRVFLLPAPVALPADAMRVRVAVALDARGGMRFEVVSRSSSSAAEAATGAAEAYEEAKIAALVSKTSAALVDVFGAGWSLARRDAARLSRFARAVSAAVSRPGAALGACLDFGDGPTLALLAAQAARGACSTSSARPSPPSPAATRAPPLPAEEEEAPAPGIPP